jgi:lipopolysaccharide biosynthesis glycosyltransferase
MLQVFVGYDCRQPVAYHVLTHSIWKHSALPLAISQLALAKLPIRRRGLTEFTYSRFLAPYLCEYKGFSLYMDADILCRGDILELLAWPVAYRECPVFVVQGSMKFEWASVMLFNNELCRNLTPEFVDNTSNRMFDFKWAASVGSLPREWNHLVGYDKPNPEAKLVHYTQGVPCWPETEASEFGDEWRQTLKESQSTVSFQELMGSSVHVQFMQVGKG